MPSPEPILAGLFFGPTSGRAMQGWMGGVMTAWDAVTYQNTVVVGGVTTYTNIPVGNPTLLAAGTVLLAMTAAGPIVICNIYQAS